MQEKLFLLISFGLMFIMSNSALAQQRADPDFDPEIKRPAYPQAKGPKVLIDAAHNNFHTADGRYAPFAQLLKKDGYRVLSSTDQFTEKSLKAGDILVIANALHESNLKSWALPTPSAFTKSEISAVHKWVKDGGALLLIADHMPFPGASQTLAASFGFRFRNGFAFGSEETGMIRFKREDGSLKDHAITRGLAEDQKINSIVTFTGQAFEGPPEAKPLLVFGRSCYLLMPQKAWGFNDDMPKTAIEGWLQGAVRRYGKGRVAVFGEAAAFTAQLAGAAGSKIGMNSPVAEENCQFVLNVMHWLSGLMDNPSSSEHSAVDVQADRTALQEDFLRLRFGLFLHFNMATYVDREWANGYEDPALFKPDKLDCRQWADVARAARMKYAVLTVKHTGGWCLWDSGHTTHDISSFINYKNGEGDVVREFVDAFRARGLKIGFYYCFPGDFSSPGHGNAVPEGKPDLHGLPPEAAGDYVGFIKRQLTELLSNYGLIDLLWIDQYSNKYTFSRWQEIKACIKSLQPRCLVIGNNAHNLRDSDVYSCEFPWDPKGMPPEGNTIPAEVCDKISRTWFWNTADGPEHVKDAQKIVTMLKLCNERKANYLLNVPPDRDGLISGAHLKRMQELAAVFDAAPSGTGRK